MKNPITFTSGELLDIIACLEVNEDAAYRIKEDPQLAAYYMNLGVKFQRMYDLLEGLPGEDRVAELVMPSTEKE